MVARFVVVVGNPKSAARLKLKSRRISRVGLASSEALLGITP